MITYCTKLKAFADDNLNEAEMITVYDRTQNNVGKEENVGLQIFLLFLQCFLKAFSVRSLEFEI